MKTILLRSGLAVLLAGPGLWIPLRGQSSYGTLVGTVTDASAAAVPGAVVTLTSVGTNERRAGETDSSGNYQFVNLVPGDYRIEVEKSGFKRLTRDQIQVTVQSTVRIDAALQVGDVGQTVDVRAETPLLQTENASIGQVVEGRTVLEMPLNGRNVFSLIALAPGVVPQNNSTGTGSLFGFANMQISGGMPNQGKFLLDGSPLNVGYINATAFPPIQDAIQEFQVQSNNLGPEFGGTLNGIVNLASKSGTNQLHGSAYEYLRNRVLNANNFFSNKAGLARPAFTQNQYGVNGGAPIKKDKTFLFAAFEGFRQRQGTTGTYTVPTQALKNGDFTNWRNAAGNQIPIYDPLTTCGALNNPACAAGQTVLRTPFPGNVIPTNRIDRTAGIMTKYWAAPNGPGTPFTATNNYITNYATGLDRDSVNFRIDQNVSDKQRIFGRFSRWANGQPPSDPFYLGISADFSQRAMQFLLADTYSISPTTILEVRAAYLRSRYQRIPNTIGFDLTTIGWPASYNPQFLQRMLIGVAITGFSPSDTPAVLVSEYSDVGSFSGSITKIRGRHTIKTGAEFSYMPTNFTQFGGGSNRFTFTTNFTAGNPGVASSNSSTGSAFASYLLGMGSSGAVTNIIFPATMQKNSGIYAGDTWQATTKLTLNYGIRWEFPGYWTERRDLATVFLPDEMNPVLQKANLGYKGDVALVNSSRYPDRHNQIPHWKLFAPRVGIAYRLTDKTVIRTGFGIQYTPGTTVQNAEPYNSPINTATTPWVPTTDGGLTAVDLFSNPFPNGVLQPAGRSDSYESRLLGTAVVMPIPNDATPYVMNWNFGVQRQLMGGIVLDLTYVGNRGVHLRMGGGGIVNGPGFNQLPSQYLSLGSQLLTQVANPFYGMVQSGPLANKTISYGQLLLPYPQYTGVNSPTSAGFDSLYHSLQAKVQRRFGQGGTLLFSYTWSKNIGNADTMTGFSDTYTPGVVQDYYNWRADRSLVTYDLPHRVSVSYVLDLPVGKGKRFLSGASGVADKVLSGWGVNGVTTLQTGFPIPLLAQSNNLNNSFGAGPIRPNVTAGCTKTIDGSAQSRADRWFNTSCFSQPGVFSFGTESRTDPNLRTHGIANWDFALFKKTTIGEKAGLEFRTEIFNLFNRVQFGVPGNAVGNASFGLISSQQNNPRLVQISLRLSF